MPQLNGTTEIHALHPYYPPQVVLRQYTANSLSVPTLLASFAAAVSVVLLSTNVIARKLRPGISRLDTAVGMWFMLCGFIHLFFEGYFSYNSAKMPSRIDLFGQLWKEYSLSDVRYLTEDSFVVCMETITAVFWGPLSFLCAALTITDHPARYSLQIVISLGQLYGDVLYYATVYFDASRFGAIFCRPERVYFWAYFVLCNAFWIVIPSCLVLHTACEITRAFRLAQASPKPKTS